MDFTRSWIAPACRSAVRRRQVLRPAVLVPSERRRQDQQRKRLLFRQVLRWVDDHTPCRAGQRSLSCLRRVPRRGRQVGLGPKILKDGFSEVLLRALLAVLDDQLVERRLCTEPVALP